MAEMVESSPKTLVQSVNINPAAINKSPPLNQQPKIMMASQTGTPDRLKVPKAFKYPERYTSPTDLMMSPISKRLLARSRKVNILPPSIITPPKVQSSQLLQEMGVSQS